MKLFTATICAATFLTGSLVAGAAEKDNGILDRIFGNESAEVVTQDRVDMTLSVKDFLGRNIINAQGERLGKVTDLTIVDATGRFDRAIVSVGGFLKLGEVLVAVPYNKIRHQEGTKDLVWQVSKEEFETMIAEAKAKAKEQSEGESAESPGGRRQGGNVRSSGEAADASSSLPEGERNAGGNTPTRTARP